MGDQLTFTYEVLKTGANITPSKLAVLLAEKGLGIAKIANTAGKLTCAISVAAVGLGVVKAAGALLGTGATGGAASGVLLVEVGSLLYDAYQMDANCGLSAAVSTGR